METLWKLLVVAVISFLSLASVYLLFENNRLQNLPKETTSLPIEKIESQSPEYNSGVVLDIISGTEYSPTEEGQFIVRLTDIKSQPLSGICYGNVAYPNKTFYINNQSMSASAFDGNYYLSFTIPSTYGIYEELVVCYVNTTQGIFKATKAGSFHVSDIRDKILGIDTAISTYYQNLVNLITNTKNIILNKIDDVYNKLYTLISNLPSQVIGQFSTQTPDWFKCVASKITGVYPIGSNC